MDRSRVFLAFFLCLIVTWLYFQYVAPPPEETVPEESGDANDEDRKDEGDGDVDGKNGGVSQGGEGAQGEGPPKGPDGAPPPPAPDDSPFLAEGTGEMPLVSWGPYLLEWSRRGGALLSMRLRDFYAEGFDRREREPTDADRHQLFRAQAGRYPALVLEEIDPSSGTLRLADREWKAQEGEDKITFSCRAGGLVFTKSIELADEYSLRVRIEIENRGKKGAWQFVLFGAPGLARETDDESFIRGLYAEGDEPGNLEVEDYALKKFSDEDNEGGFVSSSEQPLSWVGTDSKYFAFVLAQPRPDEAKGMVGRVRSVVFEPVPPGLAKPKPGPDHAARTRVEFPKRDLESGAKFEAEFEVHAGPKEVLARDPRFDELNDYFFVSIANLLIAILRLFHGLVGNFGIAIILLTISVKVVLFPLTMKQQKAMHKYQDKMKKVMPRMQALKDRYKNDRQKLNEEMLALYRQQGVNPLPIGGCLPMFIQIPILIGLFNALRFAVDLRQAPFLYIRDLSMPDRLAHLPFAIPFAGWTDLNLLPILMIFTWYYQQKLMPKSEDPQIRQQQQIMQFMPIIFGLLFYTMPSGLVLYWMTSTGLGILEQIFIKKEIAKAAAMATVPATAKKK